MAKRCINYPNEYRVATKKGETEFTRFKRFMDKISTYDKKHPEKKVKKE